MKKFFEYLGYLAVVATLLGVSLTTLISDPQKAWVALGLVALTVLFICIQVYRLANGQLKTQHPTGFLPLSSFLRYVTSDGNTIIYELFRHMQIKTPCAGSFIHKFSWTGSTPPEIKSDIQEIGAINTVSGETTSSLKLKFKKAKVFNDVEVIHLKMNLDDSDKKSGTFLEHIVNAPINFISFKVELLHAKPSYFGKQATLTRKNIEKGDRAAIEKLGNYPFEATSKSFSCNLNNPEPGYSYRLEWERP